MVSTDSSTAHSIIVDLLERELCKYSVHSHEPVVTAEDALRLVPDLTANLFKTVVFRTKAGRPVLAALPFDARIDYKSLAEVLGVNRKDLRPVAPVDIKKSVGIERGGIGPFSIVADSTVVIDDRVHDYATIKCGGGSDTLTIEIDVPDLIRVTDAIVAPISKR